MQLSKTQIRWFRLRRSGLVEPFASPEVAAGALAGVQAQILPAAGLALWNRTPKLTYDTFDRRLHEERSLIKLWGQRGALHVYPSREWPLICGALAGQPTWRERRIERQGGDVGAYRATVTRIAEMLREWGTMTRTDLRNSDLDLDEGHLSSWGGIFRELVHYGHACHAGQTGNEGRFAHREHWLPDLDWDVPPADQANAELARRFLHTYGPATEQDFRYWRGAKAATARHWFASFAKDVIEVEVEDQVMLALRADLEALNEIPPAREAWPVRMLYRFDPLLLGIKDKTWIVDEAHYERVWRPAGHIEGTLLDHGRIVGTWRYDRKGSGLVISILPFAALPAHVRAAVEEIAPQIARFFGLSLSDLDIGD